MAIRADGWTGLECPIFGLSISKPSGALARASCPRSLWIQGHVCRRHVGRVENVQDAVGKLAQNFARFPGL